MTDKRCSRCSQVKPVDDWYRNRAQSDGLGTWCKSCTDEKNKRWASENKEHVSAYARDRYLEKTYGFSEEGYRSYVAVQGGKCGICERSVDNLHIDHNHRTGKLRGLLCPECNKGLGMFRDDPILLKRASDYVEFNGLSCCALVEAHR